MFRWLSWIGVRPFRNKRDLKANHLEWWSSFISRPRFWLRKYLNSLWKWNNMLYSSISFFLRSFLSKFRPTAEEWQTRTHAVICTYTYKQQSGTAGLARVTSHGISRFTGLWSTLTTDWQRHPWCHYMSLARWGSTLKIRVPALLRAEPCAYLYLLKIFRASNQYYWHNTPTTTLKHSQSTKNSIVWN